MGELAGRGIGKTRVLDCGTGVETAKDVAIDGDGCVKLLARGSGET